MSAGIIKSPDIGLARITVEAVCHCREFHRHPHRHTIDLVPDLFGRAAFDWQHKHKDCERHSPGSVEFLSPKRFIPRGFDDLVYDAEGEAPWWLDYQHNADIKLAYAADAAFTITLASLATSSTWLVGRESTAISNTTNKYLDYDIYGKITTGTTPTVNLEIRVCLIRPINDTPTWGGGFAGTGDATATVTNTNILDRLPLLWSGTVTATSNVLYPIISAPTIAQMLGLVPDNFLVFVSHNTAVNLHATGGNHELNYRGIYLTSA